MAYPKDSKVHGDVVETRRLDSLRINLLANLSHTLYNLWLFTFSDWKAIIIPQALLALANMKSRRFASSHAIIDIEDLAWLDLFTRMPTVILWLWLTTLIQDIANQRTPRSVKEDMINKPWRPLPAKRISIGAAEGLLFNVVSSTLLFSTYLGDMVLKACAVLICIVWLYNDLDGSSSSPIIRNALIACGHVAYGVGATAVGTGTESLTTEATMWFVIVWLTIFTTSHGQDFADMEGDRARGRLTMPLLYGERTARWSLAIFTAFWSLSAPYFWHNKWFSSNSTGRVVQTMVIGIGLSLIVFVLAQRSRKGNKMVLRLWCLWIASIFALPLISLH